MTTAEENFQWWYAVGHGSEPERYNGPCGTRDEAISEALNNDGSESGYAIVEAALSQPTTKGTFDANFVLVKYDENNEECWDEDGPEITPTSEQGSELEAALDKALDEWMERHGLRGRAWAFGATRNAEYFPPVDGANQ